MEKLYTFAGVSSVAGQLTYRFGSGDHRKRSGVLRRAGHTGIQFWDLPGVMTLAEAQAWLVTQGHAAELPRGQRRGENGGTVRAIPVRPPQHDAHVRAHQSWLEAEARRRADFVARMAAARAAKRLLREVETSTETA